MHIIGVKGIGSNTYVKVSDIVKAIRSELSSGDKSLFEFATNLEGIQFNTRSGNIQIKNTDD